MGWYLIATKPEPRQRPTRSTIPEVDVVVAKPREYTVTLKSQGTVRARTQSALATEVRGRIISISPSFREGGFFEEGDILLKIDPSDYAMELTVAESTLVQRELEAAEEKARYDQAQLDLERLNLGAPSSLARREPYYQLAKAKVAAAKGGMLPSGKGGCGKGWHAPYRQRRLRQHAPPKVRHRRSNSSLRVKRFGARSPPWNARAARALRAARVRARLGPQR